MDRPEPDLTPIHVPADRNADAEFVADVPSTPHADPAGRAMSVKSTEVIQPAGDAEPVAEVPSASLAEPAGSVESAAPVEPFAPVESATPREAPVQRLDPRVINLWRVSSALWALAWTGAVGGAAVLLEWPLLLMVPMAVLGIAWTVWVPSAAYRHYAYQVGQVDVRVMHGWWTRSVAVVLHSRIQHVDTRQGPVERMMGLATVVVFTAGSVGAMVAIPGIAAGEAEALRDLLARLSGADDAV
ncbi:PH domain-containing protein [Longimicrobium sp.]|uniref:PH domain-containing protein n=1 Tax=Longimicrobium sp. TaxID=2029185 RepID=UPI003B3BDF51